MSAHTWPRATREGDVDAQRAAARRVLGVPHDATPKQLQEAYAKEALRWHPDRHSASGSREEAAAASLRFQEASDALTVLLQADAERNGTKSWVYNEAERCWEWGFSMGDGRQRMHKPSISTYDGSQGFSPSKSYRPPWADAQGQHAAAGGHPNRAQSVHDGSWWDPSWDAGAHAHDSRGSATDGTTSGNRSSTESKRLWYLMLPVVAFLLFKNAVAVAFISAGPILALAPDETIERARAEVVARDTR